jgi:hypothetical protein
VFRSKTTPLAVAAATALFAGACGEDPSSPSTDGETVADYVASASIDDTQGALHPSAVPRPVTGGPLIEVHGNLTIVNGGTATLTVTSDTPFSSVYVAGSTPISPLFLPVSGFYEIALPAPATSADLLVTFPQSLPSNDFDLYFAAADDQGRMGSPAGRSFEALTVGTGDVQVTAAWDADSDVDLHVVDPLGYEVYWAARQSPSGGELDLDSNAACLIDGVRNENITWGVGMAPQGTYTVRLDYWSGCDVNATHWTVLVNNGGDITVQHGTFTGPGDAGGLGSGILIGNFTRAVGPAPPAANRSAPVQPPAPAHK